MKDLLEPFFYPQNLFLIGLLIACIAYRKKGLWLLFAWFYLLGNSFIANQVRSWYQQPDTQAVAASTLIVLGCGGSAKALPACARSRLDILDQQLDKQPEAHVIITTRYCQPYIDYVHRRHADTDITCFNGGDNTYQEFYHLSTLLVPDEPLSAHHTRQGPVTVVTSDYHGWRASRLLAFHQIDGQVLVASTQTFRPLNCNLNCFFTVNLTNYDFYSKLLAEFFSYGVYALTRNWVDWSASEQ